MTPPMPQQVPPFDQGNMLLTEQAAQLTTAKVPAPDGERMVLTIRTASTTLTVLLTGQDAKTWAAQISREADAMSGTRLVVASGAVPRA